MSITTSDLLPETDRYDGHIHIWDAESVPSGELQTRLKEAGFSGGLLMSLPPQGYREEVKIPSSRRLEHLMAWTGVMPGLFPFFWVDPTSPHAEAELERAAEAGVYGFKVICDHFYPSEDRPMAVFRRIAEMGFPLLLHSGILGDGKFSSIYNRPVNFECLITIPDLRFALAHCGWPWCDEYLAVFLMFQVKENTSEHAPKMFIDNTVGTPHIYRKDTLTKLFDVCRIKERMFFGTDQLAERYRSDTVSSCAKRDDGIYREIGLSGEEIHHIYHHNLLNFMKGKEK